MKIIINELINIIKKDRYIYTLLDPLFIVSNKNLYRFRNDLLFIYFIN